MPLHGSAISALIEKEDTAILQEHPAINAREARSNFSKIIQAARYKNNRVIITDHGEPAAALVSIGDVKLLDLFDELNAKNSSSGSGVRDVSIEVLEKMLAGDETHVEEGDVQGVESNSR
ncbi:MAG: hypothetical protein C0457_04145 [Polymorphum sp.]|nr:hypothetical protein [Polymorphum sp.]